MKVVLGPYKSWIGPYQIADLLCWWVPKVKEPTDIISRKPEWVHEFGRWLSEDKQGNDSKLSKLCNWIESKRDRQIYVRIDKFDTWSMDHTLALIVTPMLKQLQATKHGAPNIDDADVPEHLKSTSAPPKTNEYDCDDNHFVRWDWVLGEMIWAFEQKTSDDADSQFYTRKNPLLETKDFDQQMDNIEIDFSGLRAWQARKTNGFRLFGKYYENLWD